MAPTRRTTLQFGGASALLAQFPGFAAAQGIATPGAPLFRFGVIADPQYAPVVPNLTLKRYYGNTLWKLSEAIATLNKEDLAFVVTLGDIIDRHWESFGHVLPLYDQLKAERFFLLGNHDYSVAPDYLTSVHRTTGLTRGAHYSFQGAGYRFVVLDQNEVSLFSAPPGSPTHRAATERLASMQARGAINAKPYNGGMSDAQFTWLETTLEAAKAAGERTIVMGHYPVFPARDANMLDDVRLVETLGRFPNVVAYLNGHNHAGNYGQSGTTHYVNFCGMVDTPDTTAFSVVEVYPDRLVVRGTGREPNRSLAL